MKVKSGNNIQFLLLPSANNQACMEKQVESYLYSYVYSTVTKEYRQYL